MTVKALIGKFFIVLVFINVFLVIGSFRARGLGDDSLDWQVVMKLAFWLICFCIALFFWRSWVSKLWRLDNLFLNILLFYFVVTCLYAPSFSYSLGAIFSVFAVNFLFSAADRFEHEENIMYAVVASVTLLCLVSVVVYFVNPAFGRLGEWVDGVQLPGNRLSGIAGSPNHMGFTCAFTLVILYFYYPQFIKRSAILFVFFVAVNVICLLMSNSRSSMAAMVVCLAVAYFAKLSKERMLLFCAGTLFLALVLYVIDIESLMTSLSRSGNSEEIMTGTGRTHIWETVIRLVWEKPMTGYGFASSSFILPKLAAEIGHAPPHAHNAALQALFSGGIPAMLLFVMMFVVKLYYSLKMRDFFRVALIALLIINGLAEANIFRGTVSAAHIILAIIFCLEYRRPDETSDPAYQQRLS